MTNNFLAKYEIEKNNNNNTEKSKKYISCKNFSILNTYYKKPSKY